MLGLLGALDPYKYKQIQIGSIVDSSSTPISTPIGKSIDATDQGKTVRPRLQGIGSI